MAVQGAPISYHREYLFAMFKTSLRPILVVAVVALFTAGAFAGPAAASHDGKTITDPDRMVCDSPAAELFTDGLLIKPNEGGKDIFDGPVGTFAAGRIPGNFMPIEDIFDGGIAVMPGDNTGFDCDLKEGGDHIASSN